MYSVVYFKGRAEKKETNRERESASSSAGSLPKWSQKPGLGQAEVRTQEFHGLQDGYQGSKYWGHHRLLSQVHEQKAGSEEKPLKLTLTRESSVRSGSLANLVVQKPGSSSALLC